MTTTTTSSGFESMHTALREAAIPFPPVPSGLKDSLQKAQDWLWTTRPQFEALSDIDSYFVEGMVDPETDYFMLGHEGHGVNAWFLYCYYNEGPLTVLIEAPWGGAFTEDSAAKEGIRKRFDLLAQLRDTMRAAQAAGKTLPGRLVIQQSDTSPARWAWATPSEDEVSEVHGDLPGNNALTPALEALSAL